MSILLGAAGADPQAQLNGFKSRALQAMATTAQRHLYATEWRVVEQLDGRAGAPMLLLTDDSVSLPGCECLRAAASAEEVEQRLRSKASSVVAAAVAMQRAQMELEALYTLAVALALVQAQASKVGAPTVWLFTAGAQRLCRVRVGAHAGEWGLARSVRAEVQLPVVCIDGSVSAAHQHSVADGEYELIVREASCLATAVLRGTLSSMRGGRAVAGTPTCGGKATAAGGSIARSPTTNDAMNTSSTRRRWPSEGSPWCMSRYARGRG